MKILAIDCCIRGERSSTRLLLDKFLEKYAAENEIERLVLAEENLMPMSLSELETRNELLASGQTEHEMFSYARSFKEADRIVIAAPYWDLSFPSLLKVYFEKVSVAGITFGYEGERSVGYCKAGRMVYLSTAGGFVNGVNIGFEYAKSLCAMFGITDSASYIIEGLDINPAERQKLTELGIERILSQATL